MNIHQRQTLDLVYWFLILALGGTMVAFLHNQQVCSILIVPFFILIILMLSNWKKALKDIKKEKQGKG